jgi:AcrR family transcriptional regulator
MKATKSVMAAKPRRTSELTRRAILDAAAKQLDRVGPAGLRLQDVAAEVGVSHPAVLHHFGSREGLVQAVVERSIVLLQEDLVRAFAEIRGEAAADARVFESVLGALSDRGPARLIAWLSLSGYDPFDSDAVRRNWKRLIDATHALRPKANKRRDLSYEDTQFTVVLSALALLGLAIAGRPAFGAAGLPTAASHQKQFRVWLFKTLARHLASG